MRFPLVLISIASIAFAAPVPADVLAARSVNDGAVELGAQGSEWATHPRAVLGARPDVVGRELVGKSAGSYSVRVWSNERSTGARRQVGGGVKAGGDALASGFQASAGVAGGIAQGVAGAAGGAAEAAAAGAAAGAGGNVNVAARADAGVDVIAGTTA